MAVKVKMNGAFSANLDSPAPSDFETGDAPKLKQSAAKHHEVPGRLAYLPAGRRAAVKAGRRPVHFSLDGRTLARYFPGGSTATYGHFRGVDKVCPKARWNDKIGLRKSGGRHDEC